MLEGIAVVVGMEANARHAMLFVASAQVFAPVGQERVDRAEGVQQSRAVGAAHGHESCVDVGEVVVQERVEAAGPGLGHPQSAEPAHQGRGLVVGEPPERPAREPDVDVDHGLTPFASRIGVKSRRRFSPRMSRRSTSSMSAPSTLASCEAKLRPGASLP
jgi:hypothetical protein